MLLVLKLCQNIMLQKWKFLFILLLYAVHVHCTSYLCVSDDPNEAISLLVYNNITNVQVLRPVNSEFEINLVKDNKEQIITPTYSYESLILDRRWENFPQLKENFSTSSKNLSFSVFIEEKSDLIVNINETQKISLTIKATETHSKCETSNTTITLYTKPNWSHFQILNDNVTLTVILKNINCTLNNLNLGENMTVSIDSKSTWILHNLSYYSFTADTVSLEKNEKPNYTQVSFFVKTTINGTISTVQGLNSCITVKPSEDWQFITMDISELGLSFDFDNERKRTSLSGIYLSNNKVSRIINYNRNKDEEMVYCSSTKHNFNETIPAYNNECMVDHFKYCISNCNICCKGKCYVLPNTSGLMKYMYCLIAIIIGLIFGTLCLLSGKYWGTKRALSRQQSTFYLESTKKHDTLEKAYSYMNLKNQTQLNSSENNETDVPNEMYCSVDLLNDIHQKCKIRQPSTSQYCNKMYNSENHIYKNSFTGPIDFNNKYIDNDIYAAVHVNKPISSSENHLLRNDEIYASIDDNISDSSFERQLVGDNLYTLVKKKRRNSYHQ